MAERDAIEQRLRANLHSKAAELADLFQSLNDHWGYEDPVYRFYHQSYKVFYLQESTKKIVAALRSLVPDLPLNPWFEEIVHRGTSRKFDYADNDRWTETTRPIVEAFLHARFFLEMTCRYNHPPAADQSLPSGWAALLYLFNIR